MIDAILALVMAPPAARPEAVVVEARYRRRQHRRKSRVRVPTDTRPTSVMTLRILQGEDGKWIVIRTGNPGIEDVYSRVPPFNRSKP